MNALFCHDGPTYIDNDKKYYACVLTDKLIDRYFSMCDKFFLLNRLRKVQETNGLERIMHDNIDIIEIPNLATLKGLLFDIKKAKKTIEDSVKKADFIIARLPGFAGILGIKYAKKHDKPYFIEMVGCPLDALSSHSFKGKLMAPLMYLATKRVLINSKYVIYVTDEFLQKRYPSNGYTIGCSDVEIDLDEKILDVRCKRINKISNQISLGTLGTINMKYKGFDTVIKAIVELNKKPNVEYIYKIMGAGDKTWINNIISKYNAEKYVKIYEPMPHEEVFHWLDNEIDVYIQPSRTEGMPRALIEAMSRACPCIGSSAGGIPELLDEKYVFNKTKYKELLIILRNLTKEQMIEQSNINYEMSKKYQKNVLDSKRNKFYEKFIEESFKVKKND